MGDDGEVADIERRHLVSNWGRWKIRRPRDQRGAVPSPVTLPQRQVRAEDRRRRSPVDSCQPWPPVWRVGLMVRAARLLRGFLGAALILLGRPVSSAVVELAGEAADPQSRERHSTDQVVQPLRGSALTPS